MTDRSPIAESARQVDVNDLGLNSRGSRVASAIFDGSKRLITIKTVNGARMTFAVDGIDCIKLASAEDLSEVVVISDGAAIRFPKINIDLNFSIKCWAPTTPDEPVICSAQFNSQNATG